ncbi:MAG: polymerase sigma factor [Cryobacterium sp.]|nr:polymerase sigma factor [Cryobacterium sp.]
MSVMVSDERSSLDDAADATLAARAVDGDVRAFEVIVRRHGPLMRAYATRILGSNSDADDVVQDTFITAWERLGELQDPAATKAWLMRITSRKAIDRIRARRTDQPFGEWDVPAPESESPHHQAEAASQRERLTRALATLSEAQRECWTLREIGGHSYAEIAEELDVPPSTVRGLLARARQKLMQEMEEWR